MIRKVFWAIAVLNYAHHYSTPITQFINVYRVFALPKDLYMILNKLGERVTPKQDTILSLKD